MIKAKRTSSAKAVRLNDLELSIIRKHLSNYGYTDLRDFLNQTVIQDYLNVAVHRIQELKNKVR